MINFIVCDDNKVIRDKVKKVIMNVMIKNKLAYKTHLFEDYNDYFMEKLDEIEGHRIFILDIETPSRSGIDIARIIRNKDHESSIIFLTSHEELGYQLLRSRINFLTFISKADNYSELISISIIESLKYIGVKRTLNFNDQGIEFSIPISNILYITKDTVERKTIIKTDHNEFHVYTPLQTLQDDLGNSFRQTHRSCIVNRDRVESINNNKRIIVFDTGETTDLLSNRYKRERC